MEDLATRLGRLLRGADLTARQVASKSGVALGTIENWLDRTTLIPRRPALLRVLRAISAPREDADAVLRLAHHPDLTRLAATGSADERELLRTWLDAGVTSPQERARQLLAALPRRTIPRTAPLPTPSRVLLRPNEVHLGRQTVLRQIAGHLADTALQPLAIVGAGGMGKTTLANEVVHRYGAFFAGGVWWLSFADPAAIPLELAACGGPDGLNLMAGYETLPLAQQIRLVHAAWSDALPRLLVIDGCEDPSLLATWLPLSGAYRVLVTSRHHGWEAGQRILLSEFDRPTSVQLLAHHTPGVAPDPPIVDALAAAVGDLPLALQLIGRYLQRYRYLITPAAYLAMLQNHGLAAVLPAEAMPALQHVIDLSTVRLDAACPVDQIAQQMLAVLAWGAPGEPAPRSLLRVATGSTLGAPPIQLLQTEEAMTRLTALGLVADQGNLRLHPLLGRLVREQQGPAMLREVVPRLVAALGEENASSQVVTVRPWLPHLQALAGHALDQAHPQAGVLCRELGHQFWMLGAPAQAQRWLEAARQLFEQAQDADGIDSVLNLLSLAYGLGGQYARAEALSRERLSRLAGSPPDARHGEEWNNLGYTLMLHGRYPEATSTFRRALAIRRAVHGVPSGQVGRVLHNLGYLAFKQGRLARAWRLLSWSLIMRTAIDAPAYVLALTISTLGEVALARGNPAAAMDLFRAGYELRLAWFAAAHDATAESQYLLACAWLALGDADQAEVLLAESADVTRRGLGEQHRQMVFVLTAQARVALYRQHIDQARAQLDAALAIAHAVLGRHHPETMVVWYWIGRAAAQAGDTQRAQAAFETADHGQQALLWSGHYQRAETALALARLALDGGDPQRARAILTQVIADGRRAGTLALPAFVSCRRLLQSAWATP